MDSRFFIAVLGLALLDSLNTMLFAGELYVLRGAHPERHAFAFIAGVFVVMVVGGLLLAGGLTRWVATHHPLTTSLPNLPPPLFASPQLLASESSQPQPFLPPGAQLVKPNSGLGPFPLGSSPESAAHQYGAA